ncbi:MAG: undecaprenyldiphospho-muramoylpentapeptide beta-N-acetylglucosaminyltransferase [Thermodesulfobacteriota bacterium]
MKLVMAGGGTGGHLFPALALAEEFRTRDHETEIFFIGGRHGLEESLVPLYGYPVRLLGVEGIKRKKGLARIRALVKAARSTIKAVGLLKEIGPAGVIGSGSYASAPVVAAARLLGIKTAILEQNALPGLTNRVLGRMVDRIYISFEETGAHFPASRTVLAGNPVRREIVARASSRPKRGGPFTVLVFGGSQGATAVNAAFMDAAEYLTDIWPSLRVIHQTGSEGYRTAEAAYRRKNLKVELKEFIDDMAGAYAAADLVVCRAGATSIAEITAAGLAAILIPYPFASDNHQEVNARSLADRGAAVMIRQDVLTGSVLADTIRRFFENPGELVSVRERAGALGRPGAAASIAGDFMGLLTGRAGRVRAGKARGLGGERA